MLMSSIFLILELSAVSYSFLLFLAATADSAILEGNDLELTGQDKLKERAVSLDDDLVDLCLVEDTSYADCTEKVPNTVVLDSWICKPS